MAILLEKRWGGGGDTSFNVDLGFTLTINKIVYLILLTINRALKNKIERFLILVENSPIFLCIWAKVR